nr:reverse transcriptase domain-containing protein [Tanacetum cinerariifolium]
FDLLFEVALTEEAQYKEVCKKSLRDFHKTHPSGSGTVTKIAPSAAKIKPSVTNEGSGLKPGVPGVTEEVSTEKEDKSVKTPSNDTDDEDDTNIKDKTKGDEDEGMDYTTNQFDDDVNVRLNKPVTTDEGFIQKEGTDAEMTNTKVPVTSSSHSSDLASIFLNFLDIPHIDAEIASQMDVHVHHEIPSNKTPTLLTVPVSVIIESLPIFTIIIPQSLTSFTLPPQQSTPTLPPTTKATNPLSTLLNFESIFQLYNKFITLEKEVVELKKNDPLNTQVTALVDEHLDSRLGATKDEFMSYLLASITARITKQVKSQLPQILPKEVSNFSPSVIKSMVTESLEHVVRAKESSQPKSTYEAAASLTEFELKKILIDKMDESQSYLTTAKHRECYDGLIKSYDLDKSLLFIFDKVYSLKRSQKDKDKDEDSSAGSDRVPVDYFFNKDLKYLQGGISTMTYTASITKTKATQYDPPGIEDMTFYGYARGLESSHDVYSTKRILAVTRIEVMRKHGYGYLRETGVRRADNDLYTFKKDDFSRLRINDIEDMMLLVIQNRLSNLLGNDVFDFVIALDGTLTRHQASLDEVTKNIQMEYLPQRRWSTFEKNRARIMIKATDKQLKERRMMRSFEKHSKQRIEEFNLEELSPPIVTMADQRTMAQLLQAPTEGYDDAIVVPAITADNFELKHSLLTLVQNKKFFGYDKEDPHAHIRYFNKIASTLKFPNVPNTEAWDRFKDLFRACPHHDFSELHQLDTFYNALNSKDQDSLNSAAGGNFLDKMPRECLAIIESKSKVCYSRNKLVVAKVSMNTSTFGISPDIAELKDMVKALLIDKKSQNQAPATMKAVEESLPLLRSGTLPSNTIANPRSDLKAITTRSGVSYDGPQIPPPHYFLPKVVENEPEATKDTVTLPNNRSTKDVQPQVVPTESLILDSEPVNSPIIEPVASPVSTPRPNLRPSTPYPSRLQDQKLRDKANDQREKFFQIFNDLNFHISFVDALILMPKFGPSIKSLLTNKDKICELARTPLNEHCSAVLLKKLPEKLGDPGKFLIPCDFPKKVECLALADLGASINLMPLSVWNKLSLPDLSPTCMTLELVDRLISHPVGVAEDVYVKVGELTLRVGKEAITFNLDQTSRYSANYSDMTANRIDVIDMACEEYSQEVLDFFDVIASGNPTPYYDPIVSTTSSTLTPFGNSDFLFEEVDAFLAIEYDPTSPEVDQSNPHLEYVFLEGDDKLPVIIAKDLSVEEKTALIMVLMSHKRAIAWKLSDIKGIDPEFCTHKILTEDDFEPAVQHQKRVNPKIHDVIKQEVRKLLDAGLIYPIFDSLWVSPVHCVPKKGGFTVVENEENELILTCLVTGWHVCIDYHSHRSKRLGENHIHPPIRNVCLPLHAFWANQCIGDMPFELMYDASDFAIGAVLRQRQEKHFSPIHYASKTMTEAESNYTTTEKEMLVVVYAFEKFRSYLIMNKSIVYTDHSALKYLFAKKDSKVRIGPKSKRLRFCP